MKVEHILRGKGTRIATVRSNETVETAIKLLRREQVGALVVKDVVRTEGNTVVGMFSERDVVRALADHSTAALKMTVASLMSMNVISCGLNDTLDHVRQLMNEHHIRHVPVLANYSLVGVVSARDLLAVLEADPTTAPTIFASAQRGSEHAKI